MSRVENAATAKSDPASGGTFQEISAGGHLAPPSILLITFPHRRSIEMPACS
jgi:hypothetical protein